MSAEEKPYPRRPWQPLMRSVDVVGLDVDAMVATAAADGIDSLIVNAAGFMAFYATTLPYQRRNPFMDGDFVGEVVDASHRRGLQVFGRVDVSKGYPEWRDEHPDWFVVGADGGPIGYWQMLQTCFTGTYVQEYSLAIVDELLSLHPLDGLFFNFFTLPRCFCNRCQAEVRQRTGRSVPRDEVPAPGYERWQHHRLAEHTARLRERMRTRRPGARLMVYHHLHRGWDPRLMADAADIWTAQISSPLLVNPADPQPTWPHWPGEEARKGRALKPGVPPLLVLSYSEMFASRRVLQPGERLASHMMQAVAHGGSPCLALSGVPTRQEDERPLETVSERYRELRRLQDMIGDAFLPQAIGLVYSPDSHWFGADCGEPRGAVYGHRVEFRGLYAALTDLRYGFDVLIAGRLDLDRLRSHRVVVLPAVACLAEGDAAALLDWVRQGGWLVCTGDTGWANEDGERRDEPTSRLFPPLERHCSTVDGAYLAVRSSALRRSLGGPALLGVAGPFWTLRPRPSYEDDLHLLGPFANNNPEFAFWDETALLEAPAGLIRSAVGRGGVAWLPWHLGALYYRHAVPGYPRLLEHDLRARLGVPPLQTNAPPSVEVVLREVERGEGPRRWVVFLINDTAGADRPRLTTIPLPQIALSIDRRVARATAVLSGRNVPVRRDGERTELQLERLEGAEVLILDE